MASSHLHWVRCSSGPLCLTLVAATAFLLLTAAPLVGSTAPDFKATAVFDQEFVDCSLSQYKGKYVVLFFYPLVSSGFCCWWCIYYPL